MLRINISIRAAIIIGVGVLLAIPAIRIGDAYFR